MCTSIIVGVLAINVAICAIHGYIYSLWCNMEKQLPGLLAGISESKQKIE